MGKTAQVALSVFSLAVAAWLCGAGSAFIAGRWAAGPTAPQPRFLESAASPMAEEAATGAATPLFVGAIAGLALAGAAAAATRRHNTARAATFDIPGIESKMVPYMREYLPDQSPEATTKVGDAKDVTFAVVPGQVNEEFCLGLVGTEYAGFGTHRFDPLDFSYRFPEHIPWYREAELKHGRVAMLACVGLIAPDGFRIPGEQFASPDLDMLTAHNQLIGPGLGEGPMWYLLAFCGIIESLRFKQLGLDFGGLNLETAGDLSFGKSFFPTTKEGQLQMRIKELKNGRLAMLAFGGAITQGIAWECHHFPFVPTE